MTEVEIKERIAKLETAIAGEVVDLNEGAIKERLDKGQSPFSKNRYFLKAGEWEGLNKVLGNTESAMSMLWRLRGI